jgi:A/G-specific adenine glycosylase
MELGALLCTPRSPNCAACPVARYCIALREDRVAELPKPKNRVATTNRRFIVFVIERGRRFLVQQRKAGVVNAHLWEFPNREAAPKSTAAAAVWKQFGAKQDSAFKLCEVKHSITRYRITTEAWRIKFWGQNATPEEINGVWRTRAQLRKLPFTSAHRQIANQI